VRLDAADVFAWPREDLARHIGYLPQEVELFSGTVRENIARLGEGEPEAVVEAARLAGCHEMILRLPDGYDTEIGEGGAFLSGGQRQLIGVARALYGDPKFVVLDEPNSNLDTEGDHALAGALRALKQRGCTVVMICHRPSLVQNMDKVLLLRDGQVELFGPREEVLPKLTARPVASANPVERLQRNIERRVGTA
jgi:ATP-binding cassette subfamily C protein/ATP-binding cassette subfamily C protein EexD